MYLLRRGSLLTLWRFKNRIIIIIIITRVATVLTDKAVVRNLLGREGDTAVPSVFSFLSFSARFPCLEMAPQIWLRHLGKFC